jgi:hypothetical protein
MSRQPVLKNFVSEIDQFLQEFDKQHPVLSPAQVQEQTKYRRIYRLRDTSVRPTKTVKLWEGF